MVLDCPSYFLDKVWSAVDSFGLIIVIVLLDGMNTE